MNLAAVLFLAAAGFWESKPAETWTVDEVKSILESSPWSRTLRVRGNPLEVHLASATPMREAEMRERAFKRHTGAVDASFAEYLTLLAEGAYVVLSVKVEDREAFSDGEMVNRMQRDTEMRVGKKKYPLVTHFPPSSSDPYLRLVFKRPDLDPSDKALSFNFMAPGSIDPYRRAEFFLKEMTYKGKLEY